MDIGFSTFQKPPQLPREAPQFRHCAADGFGGVRRGRSWVAVCEMHSLNALLKTKGKNRVRANTCISSPCIGTDLRVVSQAEAPLALVTAPQIRGSVTEREASPGASPKHSL